MLHKTYYISQGNTLQDHLAYIEEVCKAGVKMIQLRLKNSPLKEHIHIGQQAIKICRNHNSLLIINDNIQVAKACDADGVHVGLTDQSPAVARKLLGADKIVGGTANTLQNCLDLVEQNVDYIGLGPFRFTSTKEKLSPVLGISGYQTILEELRSRKITTPVYAIGGIQKNDFASLYESGIYGIALSSELSNKTQLELKDLL